MCANYSLSPDQKAGLQEALQRSLSSIPSVPGLGYDKKTLTGCFEVHDTMTQHVVFFHQTYPAQFRPIIDFLMTECGVKVSFLSEHVSRPVAPGVHHYPYAVDGGKAFNLQQQYFFSRYFEQEARTMFGVYQAYEAAKIPDPDVFVGHVGFGNLMFLHVAYPEIPSIGFFEIFYDPFSPETYSRTQFPAPKPNVLRMPLRNATQLIELEYCTKGYSPTPYQRSTYPKAYQPKLATLFDGIDTQLYQPGEPTGTSDLKRTWPADAKIITFVSRGLEAFRGFDVFMEAAYRLCQKRSDVHFVIAGRPQTHYGVEGIYLKDMTFKEHVLRQHPFDLSRFHFLDWVSEEALVELYRLSSLHFYWTVPFTLSWSFFQAMSTGCLVLGSNSDSVRDVLVDEVNGLMVDYDDIDGMVDRMEAALDKPEAFTALREAARETMVSHYSLEVCLPRLADFYLNPTAMPGETAIAQALALPER